MSPEILKLAVAAVRAARAQKVVLFSCQTMGDSSDQGDIDLALILPDDVERCVALKAAIRATANRRCAINLVLFCHTTWQSRAWLLARQVKDEGILAYGR